MTIRFIAILIAAMATAAQGQTVRRADLHTIPIEYQTDLNYGGSIAVNDQWVAVSASREMVEKSIGSSTRDATGAIYLYDRATMELVRIIRSPGEDYHGFANQILFREGELYATTATRNSTGRILTLDPATGEVTNEVVIPNYWMFNASSLRVFGTTLVFGTPNTNQGTLVDLESMQYIGSVILPDAQYQYTAGHWVVLSNDSIYISAIRAGEAGEVLRFDRDTFQFIERIQPPPGFSGKHFARSLDIVNQTLLIGTHYTDFANWDFTNSKGIVYTYDTVSRSYGTPIQPDDLVEGDSFGNYIVASDEAILIFASYTSHEGGNHGVFYEYDPATLQLRRKYDASEIIPLVNSPLALPISLRASAIIDDGVLFAQTQGVAHTPETAVTLFDAASTSPIRSIHPDPVLVGGGSEYYSLFGSSVASRGGAILATTVGQSKRLLGYRDSSQLPGASASFTWSSGRNQVALTNNRAVAGFPFSGEYGLVMTYDAEFLDNPQTLTPPVASPRSFFGQHVFSSGSSFLVLDAGVSTGPDTQGAAYLYSEFESTPRLTLTLPDFPGHTFAIGAALSETHVLVRSKGPTNKLLTDGYRVHFFDAVTGDYLRTLKRPGRSINSDFGADIAVSGSTVVIGAPNDTTGRLSSVPFKPVASHGSAYVYNINSGALIQRLSHPDLSANTAFGTSVEINPLFIAISAPDQNAVDSEGVVVKHAGAIHVFRTQSLEHAMTLTSKAPVPYQHFGDTMALDGDRIVVGITLSNRYAKRGGEVTVFDLCLAEMNQDGVVDDEDLQDFLQFYIEQSLEADVNMDGLVDNGDMSEFVAAYLAGC